MSEKFFNEFPAKQQKLIKETAAEAMRWSRTQQADMDERSRALLEEKGVEVNSLTPEAFQKFRDLTKPVHAKFRDKIGPEFMDEAMAFIKAHRK
jgi:TRAP-type C4-dicarboxylate transport system substrate-binding protein